SPEKVYRGGSFTVDLPAHKDYELAILGDGGKMLIISFKPAKADRIGPVLSAKAFAAMNQITISTRTARGSLSSSWTLNRPRALKRPQKIFTRSSSYEILLGPAIGSYDGLVDACWVDYYNYPDPNNPKPGEPR
ncbi:MAG: hypothetical protein ACREEA_10070, partial [Stellaceae bacterium]